MSIKRYVKICQADPKAQQQGLQFHKVIMKDKVTKGVINRAPEGQQGQRLTAKDKGTGRGGRMNQQNCAVSIPGASREH